MLCLGNQPLDGDFDAHKADFKLDRTIVRGSVVRIPKEYRQKRRLRELLASDAPARRQDLHDSCLKNECDLTDRSEEWIDYADFLSLLPTVRSQSYDGLLARSGVQEMADDGSVYYFRIDPCRNDRRRDRNEVYRMGSRRQERERCRQF